MRRPLLLLGAMLLSFVTASAQKFLHPGIDLSRADLDYMRSQVHKGEQPWKDAFERLRSKTDLQFVVKPFAHVMRGPYGRPNIGGDDLAKSARMAYDCALLWHITNDRRYAEKAIGIINEWSSTLRNFDFNDAKLLAGWTGYLFCNAAEILRYTVSGWKQSDTEKFTDMLMTVYYPLLRFYFPQANGNWDGAIIHSILAIAIFTDNREMFQNGIDHFLYAPVNGSLLKYIYPSGQCQETLRDQAHVQLGLGEFAGAARVAFTQGVDLFSAANNRIALGYEYTASFLCGKTPHSYGVISSRAKRIRDDYEYVYRHYMAAGLDMPFTAMAADSIRDRATTSVLTAFRAPGTIRKDKSGTPQPGRIAFPAGAKPTIVSQAPPGSVRVMPGESLQEALDSQAGKGGWVIATAGVHTLPHSLRIPSNVTLAGEGSSTKLFLDPASNERDAIVNAVEDLHDVVIRDLIIEGSQRSEPPNDPNSARSFRSQASRGGILFLSSAESVMKNISLMNLTVQNCTYNGVFISGATDVNVLNCDFSENGSSVVPGPRLQHNLLLSHCEGVRVTHSRLDTSPFGSGVALTKVNNATVDSCEVARNGYFGILITESEDVRIVGNFIEANDRSGIMCEFLNEGSRNILVRGNQLQYNNGFGVEAYSVSGIGVSDNKHNANRTGESRISKEGRIVMD